MIRLTNKANTKIFFFSNGNNTTRGYDSVLRLVQVLKNLLTFQIFHLTTADEVALHLPQVQHCESLARQFHDSGFDWNCMSNISFIF